jgi:hypothetical protein
MQYYYFYKSPYLIKIEPLVEPIIYKNNKFKIDENYCMYYVSKYKVISIKNIPFIDYDFDKYKNITNIDKYNNIKFISCYRYAEVAISKSLTIDILTDNIKNTYKLKGIGIFKYYSDCGNLFCDFFHNNNKIEGDVKFYYPNGNLYKIQRYIYGKLIDWKYIE